jgi:phytoene dehydrogenase-like protein
MKRPFKGLRLREGPESAYDVAIAGAGIGGLVCANLLADQGLRVLLVERHYMVGGYCSTFRRKGYTFDAASHFYPLLGNAETITGKLLRDLGVQTRWVKMDPVDHFHFPDGSRFSVSADFDTHLSKLKTEFPLETGGLDAFFADVRQAYMLGLLYYFRSRHTAQLEPYLKLSAKEVLDRHFKDPKLKLLLMADCPHWGSPPSRTSFVFDAMLRLSYFLGNYYPRGGSQAFADELAFRFEEKGGHILLNSPVQRILVEDGRACGIEVETGPLRQRRRQQVKADMVVSNADLLQTVEKWLGPEHIDPEYVRSLRRLRPTYPCFLTHIGLEGIETDELRRAQGYYWDSWDAEQVGNDGLKFKIFVPTLFEPDMAPPGGHIVIVQKVLDIDFEAIEDWQAHKAEIDQYITRNLANILPGLADKTVIKMSASALTSQRFTLNHHGAMLGWEMAPDQLGEDRPGICGPLKNLYFAGHWTQPGGGITPAIVSAMQVAEQITTGAEAHVSAAACGSEADGVSAATAVVREWEKMD